MIQIIGICWTTWSGTGRPYSRRVWEGSWVLAYGAQSGTAHQNHMEHQPSGSTTYREGRWSQVHCRPGAMAMAVNWARRLLALRMWNIISLAKKGLKETLNPASVLLARVAVPIFKKGQRGDRGVLSHYSALMAKTLGCWKRSFGRLSRPKTVSWGLVHTWGFTGLSMFRPSPTVMSYTSKVF